ncbi:hypothetical protein DFA_09013 [Cavenderia fasciculata]|uniref:Uncharacterized protein n=1 Tax=Cavenderia fasciculata TaxID=261658 RepID=F4Q6G5_CACFS|nr:uncharacterized protein DFA_09013 [Cavenderia fasciculata]EGG16475.1 hypothetical protein DFA_09013 [Cavenderia fasciculata]|eukprot:XP_004354875.1 hypothetical protein DFA_09013 [Cavenderia fasciculata]
MATSSFRVSIASTYQPCYTKSSLVSEKDTIRSTPFGYSGSSTVNESRVIVNSTIPTQLTCYLYDGDSTIKVLKIIKSTIPIQDHCTIVDKSSLYLFVLLTDFSLWSIDLHTDINQLTNQQPTSSTTIDVDEVGNGGGKRKYQDFQQDGDVVGFNTTIVMLGVEHQSISNVARYIETLDNLEWIYFNGTKLVLLFNTDNRHLELIQSKLESFFKSDIAIEGYIITNPIQEEEEEQEIISRKPFLFTIQKQQQPTDITIENHIYFRFDTILVVLKQQKQTFNNKNQQLKLVNILPPNNQNNKQQLLKVYKSISPNNQTTIILKSESSSDQIEFNLNPDHTNISKLLMVNDLIIYQYRGNLYFVRLFQNDDSTTTTTFKYIQVKNPPHCNDVTDFSVEPLKQQTNGSSYQIYIQFKNSKMNIYNIILEYENQKSNNNNNINLIANKSYLYLFRGGDDKNSKWSLYTDDLKQISNQYKDLLTNVKTVDHSILEVNKIMTVLSKKPFQSTKSRPFTCKVIPLLSPINNINGNQSTLLRITVHNHTKIDLSNKNGWSLLISYRITDFPLNYTFTTVLPIDLLSNSSFNIQHEFELPLNQPIPFSMYIIYQVPFFNGKGTTFQVGQVTLTPLDFMNISTTNYGNTTMKREGILDSIIELLDSSSSSSSYSSTSSPPTTPPITTTRYNNIFKQKLHIPIKSYSFMSKGDYLEQFYNFVFSKNNLVSLKDITTLYLNSTNIDNIMIKMNRIDGKTNSIQLQSKDSTHLFLQSMLLKFMTNDIECPLEALNKDMESFKEKLKLWIQSKTSTKILADRAFSPTNSPPRGNQLQQQTHPMSAEIEQFTKQCQSIIKIQESFHNLLSI